MGYVVLLFSLSAHESAHAWTALRLGDDTAARQGRITLNPIPHIDLFGTVVIPALQLLFTGIPLLGWARPTPVSPQRFRRLARGQALVSAAGPLSNVMLALLFAAVLFVGIRLFDLPSDLRRLHPMTALLTIGVQMNVVLALFNLVPLPPLDGFAIVSWSLPRSFTEQYDRVMESFGQWILLALFATGVLGKVLKPFTTALATFLLGLVR